MQSTKTIAIPTDYLNNVHPDTAKVLSLKTKGIRFSLPLFSYLMLLMNLAASGLHKAHKEAETDQEKHAVLDKFMAADRAVSCADAIGEIQQNPHTRLLLLTESELDALFWLLELAKGELDYRMASPQRFSDDIGNEMQALHHAGLAEVIATLTLNTCRIESDSKHAA
jgi:hypothetical protein